MRIVGLDVGRGAAVAIVLDSFPVNITRFYKLAVKQKCFYKLITSASGVAKLLSLSPDGIVLEPSGHWYAHFWVKVACIHNIKIFWVGHSDLDKLRGSYGFTNKRDTEDALCLAAIYFDDRFINSLGQRRFISYYYPTEAVITRLRELFLEKEQLQKLRTNLIAQLRQRLSYEFPEAAKHTMNISPTLGFTPIVSWLATKHSNRRYDNKYARSIVHQLDIAISDYTRCHSKTIVDLETRITQNYDWLREVIVLPEFEHYLRVFERFGFGLDNQVLLLYHCYPFDKFLVDGQPWVERELGNNGKYQKRDRSLRKFQAFMGMSFKYQQSGDSNQRSYHGSSLVRSHLYVWAVCMVAPSKYGYRIKSDIGKQLSDRYRELRVTVKGKDAIIRILFKATRMLFYELLRELKA